MRQSAPRTLSLSILVLSPLILGVTRSLAQSDGTLMNQRPQSGHAGPGLGAGARAPSWRNTSWLNSEHPLSIQELRGRVVLLNFWTFSCYNCTGAIPSLVEYDRKYRDRGLVVIGIHTPEFPPYGGEHDQKNLAAALQKYGIEYPNAQDNDGATWGLYRIRYWPSYTLIDRQGKIRYEGYGEFHVGDTSHRWWAARIEELLQE